jgi:hypothetical protein
MTKTKKLVFISCGCAFAIGLVLGAFWHREKLFPFPQLSAWKSKGEKGVSRPGRWTAVAQAPSLDGAATDQKEAIQRLQALGYLSGTMTAPSRDGLTVHDPQLAYQGLNLVISGHAPEARLITMSGREVYKWACDVHKAWPDFEVEERFGKNITQLHTFWRRAHVMKNGDLLVIFEGLGLVRLDKDSNVLWSLQNGAHHDLDVGNDGRLYVLTRKAHVNPDFNGDEPILEDFITVLDQQGHLLKEVSILQALKNSKYSTLVGRLEASGDILHSNTLEIMEEKEWDRPVPWTPGMALVSILKLDLVCFIDLETETITWAESDLWRRQHQPTVLDNGNILVLNNHATEFTSSVLEVDPTTMERVWYYGAETGNFFRTDTCGTSQRLPNGNTLITESDPGRAFEITPDKTTVWEYINPHRAGKDNELIASLLEVVRLESDFTEDLLLAVRGRGTLPLEEASQQTAPE